MWTYALIGLAVAIMALRWGSEWTKGSRAGKWWERGMAAYEAQDTAAAEADGSVRVVVARRDPRHPNWIPTLGHRQGTMCWRWIKAEHHPQPATRVVQLSSF